MLFRSGYGEEAGLCTRVMDHMHKQAARIAALEAALKPFANANRITSEHREAARAAMLASQDASQEGKDD